MSKSGQSILRGARRAKRTGNETLTYDALIQPDPQSWLALSEDERIRLVEDYHRRERVPLPRRTAHALFHILIENQIADGGEPAVQSTVERLIDEGLNRHDALHAVATIMVEMMDEMARNGTDFSPEAYRENLEQLTAQSWLHGDWEC